MLKNFLISRNEAKEGKGNKPSARRMLTDEEADILYGQSLLRYSSSEALINTLWLNNTQFFGLRGCQEHRDMRWGDVERKTTADGTAFLGPVVRKPINANPRSKVNPLSRFFARSLKIFLKVISS